ncbi:hypothetical protein AMTR_s00050p00181300 [Amborella trichopoda]|uniref:Uncharacterized protein n=1 Tax=Amborella trichopoda TaxID=13333 RepID=W1PXD6_AMBTC|nr:hypothetical protein AMTR_s00050p00181300 [Amborella trichopoda]
MIKLNVKPLTKNLRWQDTFTYAIRCNLDENVKFDNYETSSSRLKSCMKDDKAPLLSSMEESTTVAPVFEKDKDIEDNMMATNLFYHLIISCKKDSVVRDKSLASSSAFFADVAPQESCKKEVTPQVGERRLEDCVVDNII